MPKHPLFFLLMIATTCISCNSDDINDSNKRNNNWDWWVDASTGKGKWIPVSDHPTWKNGTYFSFYYDGKLYGKGKIRDGKHVDTTFWFKQDGKIYGYKIHQGDTSTDYIIADGPIKIFDIEGQIRMEGIVKNHKAGDKWTDYYKNGFVKRTMDYINDTGQLVHFYENQQIQDSEFAMGEKFATIKHWNKDGQLTYSIGWKNNKYDGDLFDYYDNGQVKMKARFVNGMVEGEAKSWYLSGKIKVIAYFILGAKTGKQIEYFENGQIKADFNMIDGKLDGEQKEYDETGKLIEDIFYKDGVPVK